MNNKCLRKLQWTILITPSVTFSAKLATHAAKSADAQRRARCLAGYPTAPLLRYPTVCPCLYGCNCFLRLLNQSTKQQKLKICFFNYFSCWEGNLWTNIFAKELSCGTHSSVQAHRSVGWLCETSITGKKKQINKSNVLLRPSNKTQLYLQLWNRIP